MTTFGRSAHLLRWIVVCAALACSDPDQRGSMELRFAQEAMPDPAPVETAPADPVPMTAGDAARAAYRAAIDAYNDGDADAYFSAFADPLSCYYGRAGQPLASLRSSRGPHFADEQEPGAYFVASLDLVRASADEVVLADRGAYWIVRAVRPGHARSYMRASADAMEQGVHEKVVVMRRVNDAWRIAAETDLEHSDCAARSVPIPGMPVPLAACRTANRDCLRRCDRTCETCGSCDGCDQCPSGCARALGSCTGAGADFSTF